MHELYVKFCRIWHSHLKNIFIDCFTIMATCFSVKISYRYHSAFVTNWKIKIITTQEKFVFSNFGHSMYKQYCIAPCHLPLSHHYEILRVVDDILCLIAPYFAYVSSLLLNVSIVDIVLSQ